MDEFTIRIAEHNFAVKSLYETTRLYLRNYLSADPADYEIFVTDADMTFEQALLDQEAREEGLKRREFTGPFLERMVIQRKVSELLLQHDTLLLHGSTVAVDANAYLFTAACGTGKSTHTRFWRELFGERAVMVNDDKTFLRVGSDCVTAFGSPWSGKHGLDHNISAPLKGICVLSRGPENKISRVNGEIVRDMLLHQCQIQTKPQLQLQTEALVDKLLRRVFLWTMSCTKHQDAAAVAYGAMSGNVNLE